MFAKYAINIFIRFIIIINYTSSYEWDNYIHNNNTTNILLDNNNSVNDFYSLSSSHSNIEDMFIAFKNQFTFNNDIIPINSKQNTLTADLQ